jgi:hypothetical protein
MKGGGRHTGYGYRQTVLLKSKPLPQNQYSNALFGQYSRPVMPSLILNGQSLDIF